MVAQAFEAPVGLPIERIGELFDKFPGASFRRYGGVLRVSPGDPLGRGGVIAAHLSDTPSFDASRVTKSLEAVQHMSDLATAFSGVAAAASVLNLGVSVAGFAIMNRKLGRLSTDLHDFRQLAEQRFERLDEELGSANERLIELGLLAGAIRGELAELRADTQEIGRLLDLDRLVKLSRILERLEAGDYLHDPQLASKARDDLIELRHFFEGAIAEQPALGARMVRDLGYFQAWALTCAVEARLLRSIGNTKGAREVLVRGRERMLAVGRTYGRILLGPCPPDFLAPCMERDVSPATYTRWLQHLEPEIEDPAEILRRSVRERNVYLDKHKLSPAQYLGSLDPDVLRRRAMAAERLFGIFERLDAYQLELDYCERHDLTVEVWEGRGLEGASASGLYFTALP